MTQNLALFGAFLLSLFLSLFFNPDVIGRAPFVPILTPHTLSSVLSSASSCLLFRAYGVDVLELDVKFQTRNLLTMRLTCLSESWFSNLLK